MEQPNFDYLPGIDYDLLAAQRLKRTDQEQGRPENSELPQYVTQWLDRIRADKIQEEFSETTTGNATAASAESMLQAINEAPQALRPAQALDYSLELLPIHKGSLICKDAAGRTYIIRSDGHERHPQEHTLRVIEQEQERYIFETGRSLSQKTLDSLQFKDSGTPGGSLRFTRQEDNSWDVQTDDVFPEGAAQNLASLAEAITVKNWELAQKIHQTAQDAIGILFANDMFRKAHGYRTAMKSPRPCAVPLPQDISPDIQIKMQLEYKNCCVVSAKMGNEEMGFSTIELNVAFQQNKRTKRPEITDVFIQGNGHDESVLEPLMQILSIQRREIEQDVRHPRVRAKLIGQQILEFFGLSNL